MTLRVKLRKSPFQESSKKFVLNSIKIVLIRSAHILINSSKGMLPNLDLLDGNSIIGGSISG